PRGRFIPAAREPEMDLFRGLVALEHLTHLKGPDVKTRGGTESNLRDLADHAEVGLLDCLPERTRCLVRLVLVAGFRGVLGRCARPSCQHQTDQDPGTHCLSSFLRGENEEERGFLKSACNRGAAARSARVYSVGLAGGRRRARWRGGR